MALRSFADDNGAIWQVWDVLPSQPELIERRKNIVARLGGDERRAGPALAEGWLAFESERGRRRLAPIPSGWENATDDQLKEWCTQARNAARRIQWMRPDPPPGSPER